MSLPAGATSAIAKHDMQGDAAAIAAIGMGTPTVHSLLRHCHDIEDVVCMVKDKYTTFDDFFESLVSDQDSKIKRLAIPLGLWSIPSDKLSSAL